MFKFVQWTGLPYVPRDRSRIWVYYHRLANAGRLQLGPLCLMWPMPWVKEVRNLPGYGFGKPSGIRAAMGWRQRRSSEQ